VAASLAALKAGQCQYAVVPVENTIGGPVYNYLDAVTGDDSFVIVGEVDLPIRQTLLALPEATLGQIKTVMSHPQGIAQSKDWLKANLPEAKIVEVSSTAEAAKKVAEAQDPSLAAIAASRTADVYHLNILATDLQYTDTNVTRFWVVALKTNRVSDGERAALLVQGPVNLLAKLLAELDQKGYKILTLHDRPTQVRMGEYRFVVEIAAAKLQPTLDQVLARQALALQVRVVGTYNSK
jgi:prephenate dehydratase